MISGAHTARHREALRGVQQLANHHITRTFLNSDCSGSELDSGISFLGSREASGHSSFVDRKQGSSRHFMSTPSSSDLKTQDRSPFQLDSRRSLKTSSLFKGELGWAAGLGREGSREVLAGPFGQVQRRHYIQLKTELLAADNSGAKRLSCIKVLKGTRPNAAGLGDIIVCSVKEALPRGKVKKGEVVTCVVVRSAMHHERSDGGQIRFDENAAVVINKAGEPIGTRVFGPVPHELREKKFMKILTLAQQVI